ncbi:MAG: DUF1285 domain-containing protein [Alcanivoracaceae bacterium]
MARSADQLAALLADLDEETRRLPPVHRWHPPLSGDIDIRIAVNGDWYHDGDRIERHALVQLFSSILRREGDDYFLVTPVEKWRIRVDDLPFVAHSVECMVEADRQLLVFTTNVNSRVLAGDAHQIQVEVDPVSAEPSPALDVRDGLKARISRVAFYQLAEWAEERDGQWWVESDGCCFSLGLS